MKKNYWRMFIICLSVALSSCNSSDDAEAPKETYGGGITNEEPAEREAGRIGVCYSLQNLYNSVVSDNGKVFDLLAKNSLRQLRFTLFLTDDAQDRVFQQFEAVSDEALRRGIVLTPIIMTAFAWGGRTDNGKYPAGDADALYRQGYNRSLNFLDHFGDRIKYAELANEVNLERLDENGNRLYGRGWTASEFAGDTHMEDWAHVLRGMSNAVAEHNDRTGHDIKIILGTTSSNFGFLDFMLSRGVNFDVIGYHYYERYRTDPLNYWRAGGLPTFNLFQKMAEYERPVHVNEFNCAEIYLANYENLTGSYSQFLCELNLDTMLNTFLTQKWADIEYISIYSLVDEPHKAPPENRFGLFYDYELENPKNTFATAVKYAKITEEEKNQK